MIHTPIPLHLICLIIFLEIRSLHKFSNSSSDLQADILNTNDDFQTIDDDLQMDDTNCLLNRNNVLCSAQELSRYNY